ncbi:hypothetical protein LMG23992_02111 [Cupriavidus laharis]|uniref:Tyr recombinase domain-containing protein n=1 Tax=Cupriavidus laharis TaxID=151654 RepID=A0ABM8WX08_9BURK|nr:site-specific integrase [Cupriavidus laharis]CAG9172070.1 hypothetical protein LMG23992_02111 [Cupriavidus laharis]
MATKIDTKTARQSLVPRREPYWDILRSGVAVGYRKMTEDESAGQWQGRYKQEDGSYVTRSFGVLDDDGKQGAYAAAVREVNRWAEALDRGVSPKRITVADVCADYVKHLRVTKGKKAADDAAARYRREVDCKPIAKIALDKLSAKDLRKWVSDFIDARDPEDEEDMRKAKVGLNRNLAVFKAALNLAFKDQLVASDGAWKGVVPFKDVNAQRKAYLTVEERRALLKFCEPDLERLVRALLLTGARAGELATATVADFDKAHGLLAVDGKTGKRAMMLSTAAMEFFAECAKGKIGQALLLTRADGAAWHKDWWKKVFREAAEKAKLPDDVVLYTCRHVAISEMIMGGMDSAIVADITGTSVLMIERNYGKFKSAQTRSKLDAVMNLV